MRGAARSLPSQHGRLGAWMVASGPEKKEKGEMLVSVQVGRSADGWKCDCGTWKKQRSWEVFSVLAAHQSDSGC